MLEKYPQVLLNHKIEINVNIATKKKIKSKGKLQKVIYGLIWELCIHI